MFTDAWIIGQEKLGPYTFLNNVPNPGSQGKYALKPSITLRVQTSIEQQLPDMTKTADEHYHGGALVDEIAALASLVLGIRLEAGPLERTFEVGADPRGRPSAHLASDYPVLPINNTGPQIPWLHRDAKLAELIFLETFPNLKQADAIAVVKSARQFQKALWLSDASPEIAWLMFVSSVEIAANNWDKKINSPLKRLETSYPKLVKLLDGYEGDLTNKVAAQLSGVIGSISKFKNFMIYFKPPAPVKRPEHGLFDFEDKNFKKSMIKIYEYRSNALHGGIQFPYPMCNPPPRISPKITAPEEKPIGLATSALGGTWKSEDTPMYLHLFAYIVRHSLLKWWGSLVGQPTT
ncbi:hypothetical protein [uncultured Roseibium sp.]|uniref:hypothetical protein n=1 Tax=uncultured Roseibium sp. TaxID=1936171 RepID=UPI003216898F